MPYVEYSMVDKYENSFEDSQMLAAGVAFYMHRVYISADLYFAREHPYIGPDTFVDGLGQGGGNADWHTFFLIAVGYYF